MCLPALLHFLAPEKQQPGHDDEHASPGEELDEEEGEVDPVPASLCIITEGYENRNSVASRGIQAASAGF